MNISDALDQYRDICGDAGNGVQIEEVFTAVSAVYAVLSAFAV